jgi:hypothetical protein
MSELIHPERLPQEVWLALFNLALPLVKSHPTDFYHDVVWLNRHLAMVGSDYRTRAFYFGADECGTHIGEHAPFVLPYRKHGWQITMTPDNARNVRYSVEIVKVK